MLSRLRWLACLPLLIATVCTHAQQKSATNELKDAIPRPQFQSQLSLPLASITDEYKLMNDIEGRRTEIAALRHKLTVTPDDAALWMRLGEHYSATEQKELEDSAYAEAIRLLRLQLKSAVSLSPVERAKLMAQLGKSIWHWSKGEAAEAENLIRDAVKLAPDEWSVWKDLAIFLPTTYPNRLFPERGKVPFDNLKNLDEFQSIVSQLKPQNIEAAKQMANEALRCADTAVRLAPNRSEPYITRVRVRMIIDISEVMFLKIGKEKSANAPSTTPLQAWMQSEGLGDMRLSMRYAETAFDTAHPALSECFAAFMKAETEERAKGKTIPPDAIFSGAYWKKYPSDTRKAITEAVNKLQGIAMNRPQERALALASLGVLQMQMGQKNLGLDNMRSALKLHPGYNMVRELLIGFAISSSDFAQGESLLQENVQTADTPRNRLVLAQFYAQHGNYDQERRQLALARKWFPRDGMVLLWAASDLLSEHLKAKLGEVTILLDEADKKLAADDTNRPIYELLRGIQAYLGGKQEEGIGRIKAVTANNPNNEQATELLELLERK